MSIGCPVMTATTWGWYMHPFWSRVTGVVGVCQFLSGSPDLTQTNVFFRVPLELTTTSSDFWPFGCARVQNGVADISSVLAVGAVPSNATLPVTAPPFA